MDDKCRLCQGEHPVYRCPSLSLKHEGRLMLLNGPIFDLAQQSVDLMFNGKLEIVGIEVKVKE